MSRFPNPGRSLPSQPDDGGANAFTVVYCDKCDNGEGAGESALVSALSRTVGRSPHGVLVRATCLFGGECASSGGAGPDTPVVLVQRCDRVTRKPLGHAVTVGPVRTTPEVNGLIRWLESSDLTLDELPLGLRRAHYRRMAPLN